MHLAKYNAKEVKKSLSQIPDDFDGDFPS